AQLIEFRDAHQFHAALYLYALAAAGQAGVEKTLGNFHSEIERGMKLMGITKLDQLSRENLRFHNRVYVEAMRDYASDAARNAA
ncbi:MAG: alpha-hydroxy-acid oxidizing protein, partial [Pseudomonadota bacterium]